MAKGIYIGVEEEITFISTENIFPSSWTDVSPTDTPGTSYIASDGSGIKLTASGYKWRTPDIVFNDTIEDLYWCGADGADEDWICIEFPEARFIAEMKTYIDLGSSTANYIYIQGSVDGATWTKLKSFNTTQTGLTSVTLSNTNYYKYYRWYMNSSTKNLSIYQIQGFERITTNKGVARKAKKAYVGATNNNLVVNGDFSDGIEGWMAESVYVLGHYENNYMNVMVSSPSNVEGSVVYINNTAKALPANHVYYGRFDMKGWINNELLVPSLILRSASTYYTLCRNENYNNTEWTSVSGLYTPSKEVEKIGFQMTAQNTEGTLASGMRVFIDNVAVYDLTALYGAGNEPTQEWCDANLEALAKKSVAHKVKKGYIGVGGVARPFFSTEQKLEYYGTLTNGISTREEYGTVAKTGDYALFARGYSSSKYQAEITTISSKLVRGTATDLSKGRNRLKGASVGNYALFAGGEDANNTYATVDTYTSSLAKGTASNLSVARVFLESANVGNYALFAGGRDVNSKTAATVDAYSSTLTKATSTSLTTARYRHTGVAVGNYALFAGGTNTKTVETYTSSLVKGTATDMTKGGEGVSATSLEDYALIGNGYYNSSSQTVDVYSSALVKTTTSLSGYRYMAGSTTVGDYALFAGGYANSYVKIVDVFKPDLIRETARDLSLARAEPIGVSVGDYALFVGGSTTTTQSAVDVYQLVES